MFYFTGKIMSVINKRKNIKNIYYIFDNKEPLYVEHIGWHKLSPRELYKPTVRPYYLLHFVVEGSGYFHLGENVLKINAGQAFLIHPGETTFYRPDETNPWEYYWIAFSGNFAKTLIERTTQNRVISYKKSGVLALQSALNHEKEDSITTLDTLFSVLAAIQDSAQQTEQTTKTIIFNALHYLENNYFNDIHIETLASSFGYSRAHFTTLFTQETGISPYLYLTQIRIKKAKEYLTNTKHSIEEISYSVGFSSIGRFSELFKKYENITPLGDRKTHSIHPKKT